MKHIVVFFALLTLFSGVGNGVTANQDQIRLGPSGYPLPRFVSIKAEKTYIRTGPGRQYPIDWVYSRKGLPLEIIEEHGPWRKIRDHENIEGWMLVSLLSSKRTAMIFGRTRSLYKEPDLNAPLSLTADPGVIGTVLSCKGVWCRLEIDDTKAWIERRHLWGVYPDEELD